MKDAKICEVEWMDGGWQVRVDTYDFWESGLTAEEALSPRDCLP